MALYSGKIFGVVSGWFLGRLDGAIAGFLTGAVFDEYVAAKRAKNQEQSGNGRHTHYESRGGERNYRVDFNYILVSLSALVMRSDGKTTRPELDYVKDYFVKQFGVQKARQNLLLLRDALKQEIRLDQVCGAARSNMNHHERLQLLHYLFGVAYADGKLSGAEQAALKSISLFLEIDTADFSHIGTMFGASTLPANKRAYEILGLEQSATEDTIKKVYRQMALKYHPDRVTHLGEDVCKSAEEKFKKIQEAYETVKKEKGIA